MSCGVESHLDDKWRCQRCKNRQCSWCDSLYECTACLENVCEDCWDSIEDLCLDCSAELDELDEDGRR